MRWASMRAGALALFACVAVLAVCALLGSCAARNRHAPKSPESATKAHWFEPAAPLELEAGSYGKSQRDRYNKIYADSAAHTSEPNEFLLACLDRIEKIRTLEMDKASLENSSRGKALDIAMGEGRNTIALAQRGYHAVGFDVSDVGVNTARRRAAELGLDINAHVQRFGDFDIGIEQWDLVILMYFSLDDSGMKRVADSIKPHGFFIIERSGGDVNTDFLRQLPADQWKILHYSQDTGPRDWANATGHPGDGPRTRVLARKRL